MMISLFRIIALFIITISALSCSGEENRAPGYYIRFKLNGTEMSYTSSAVEMAEKPMALQDYNTNYIMIVATKSPTNFGLLHYVSRVRLTWHAAASVPNTVSNIKMNIGGDANFSGTNVHITVTEHGNLYEPIVGSFKGVVDDGAGSTNYITEGSFRVFRVFMRLN